MGDKGLTTRSNTLIEDQQISRKDFETELTDNITDLLAVLPRPIADRVAALQADPANGALIEIVMDLGRPPEARFHDREIEIADADVTRDDLQWVAERVGQFGDDNRAGIERTLHRISAIRNRAGDIVGLTCRIGRAVFGTIAIIEDLVESGQSILLLGRPGVGKTTMLRESARVLADQMRKRVIIVDTSNEIAGDGDIPHPAIGRARRMQVPTPLAQHAVMIEAVENHMPQVIVIDEIGTELEAGAARTIAERGVQLIGTAHGNELENLMMNPTLSDLIGGIQSVTLSDEEARRRGTQKSILERKAPPTFSVMVEIINRDEVAVHLDVAATVDSILRNGPVKVERRRRLEDGSVETVDGDDARRDPSIHAAARPRGRDDRRSEREPRGANAVLNFPSQPERTYHHDPETLVEDEVEAAPESVAVAPLLPKGRGTPQKPLRIYPFGVSRNRLDTAINQLRVPAIIVRDMRDADMVMTLKSYFRQKPQPIRDAEARGTSVYVLRSNTAIQMEHVLTSLFPTYARRGDANGYEGSDADAGQVAKAMLEAEEAITSVLSGAPPIALAPQDSHIRKLQHALAERYNIGSRSTGREPQRRVEIYRHV
ncbi:MAG: AAA family ATPase [Thermomicrobiales bacterium]|nr:AAA family ATPase [Thermomicrobiales bacterium]